MSNYNAITGSSKIVHRNQCGGSKLQGIPSSTNLNTWSHVAFRNRNVVCPCNRNLIFYMNQLGGIGRYKSQFCSSADGVNIDKKEIDLLQFKEFIFNIQQSMQNVISKALNNVVGTSPLDRNTNNLNNISNYNLCLVGSRENFFNDLTKIGNDLTSYSELSINGMTRSLNIFNGGEQVIFTHLLSNPKPENTINNPLRISRFFDASGTTEFDIPLELNIPPDLQKKINFCNAYLRTLVPFLFTKESIEVYGRHTLGIINNNIKISKNSTEQPVNATRFLQNEGFGLRDLDIDNTPPIYIFSDGMCHSSANICNRRL